MTTKHAFALTLSLLALGLSLLAACIPAQASSYMQAYNFKGGTADGAYSYSGLSGDSAGNGYGTTLQGGAYGFGTVYKITPAGRETVLHSFAGGTDGANPYAGLTLGKDGNFYGTTYYGGSGNSGTVYKITPTGQETVLYAFTGGEDGLGPFTGLVQAKDGNFYGTTLEGGLSNSGTVYKITSRGALTTVYSFLGDNDGTDPQGTLIQATDGNLYGTTYGGGTYGFGTVYKITTSGQETVLYAFTDGADGRNPYSGLIQATDGYFYGTTEIGGIFDGFGEYGTFYKITPSGTLTTLYSFGINSHDGAFPLAEVIQGKDGNFYGTTSEGGGNSPLSHGTVYQITPTGQETVIHTFFGSADGSFPTGPLVQDRNGYLYGTTEIGGPTGFGTIYRIIL